MLKNYSECFGKKINKWTILGADRTLTQKDGKYKRLKLKCQCDCGNIKLVDYHNLIRGKTRGCRQCILPRDRNASFNFVLAQYKNSARKRKLEWNLSEDDFKTFILSSCVYCGSNPSRQVIVKGCLGELICNGIDRKDSSIGYVLDNCVSCCSICNYMKQEMSTEDFFHHIREIVKFNNL